ncbi:MAG: hypothetical protein C0490_19295, partial [Marivirga sp.]|nr:hypothetical protein [Marivirga sp.]
MARHTRTPGQFMAWMLITMFLACVILPVHQLSAQRKNRKKTEWSSAQQNLVLAKDQTSVYRIVIPAAATAYESKAAQVLQHYLLEISGAALP